MIREAAFRSYKGLRDVRVGFERLTVLAQAQKTELDLDRRIAMGI